MKFLRLLAFCLTLRIGRPSASYVCTCMHIFQRLCPMVEWIESNVSKNIYCNHEVTTGKWLFSKFLLTTEIEKFFYRSFPLTRDWKVICRRNISEAETFHCGEQQLKVSKILESKNVVVISSASIFSTSFRLPYQLGRYHGDDNQTLGR
jgi:hypothetical protein